MITRRTLLILGAGASIPFGFPSGRKLKDEICAGLSKEAAQPFTLLRACGFDAALIGAFRDALQKSGRSSVDAFLEHRPDFLTVGKTAIAAALMPYEVEDRLFGGERNWYEYLYRHLIGSRADIPPAQERLAVITFNYERSFEHFLFTALRNSFNLSAAEARQHVKGFAIVHVYGQLGELSLLSDEGGARPYAPAPAAKAAPMAYQAADAIKIVHEGALNEPEFRRAWELINKAEVICFLGFGYLPENVERLRLARGAPTTTTNAGLLGSAFGLAIAERQAIIERFGHVVYLGPDNDEPERWDVLDFLRHNRVLA